MFETYGTLSVGVFVLVCPLMMIGMMLMMMFPFGHRMMGGHGGHMYHHGSHGADHDEEEPSER